MFRKSSSLYSIQNLKLVYSQNCSSFSNSKSFEGKLDAQSMFRRVGQCLSVTCKANSLQEFTKCGPQASYVSITWKPLEIQISWSNLKSTESNALGVGPSNLWAFFFFFQSVFNKPTKLGNQTSRTGSAKCWVRAVRGRKQMRSRGAVVRAI